jgi:hypothetical protein
MPGSFRVHFPAQRQEAGVLFGILIYEGVEPFDLATYVVLSMALFARSGRAAAHPPCPKSRVPSLAERPQKFASSAVVGGQVAIAARPRCIVGVNS